MSTRCFFLIIFISPLLTILTGCSRQPSTSLDEVLALYRQNKLEEAFPLLVKLVEQDPDNPEKRVWLSEMCRRLGRKDEAVKNARIALTLDSCSSFAHTVIAEATNPVLGEWSGANADTTWFHLMKAIACDSTDGHPWLVIFGEAMHQNEPALVHRSLRTLVESGFLTKAALAYGRWMLRALPRDAVLLTNGDMDTYPPCAVQEVEGFRKDVVIVNRGTLETKWYARFLRDHAGVSLPVDEIWLEKFQPHRDAAGNLVRLSDEIFHKWIERKSQRSFRRPIAVAVTVEEQYYSRFKDNFRFSGAFHQWQDAAAAPVDTASMLASLEGMSPDDLTGPWVSEKDRSPIRRVYTKNLVRNVTETAIMSGELLLGARRISEADQWTSWADELDRKAELGPVFTRRITQLKERLAKANR